MANIAFYDEPPESDNVPLALDLTHGFWRTSAFSDSEYLSRQRHTESDIAFVPHYTAMPKNLYVCQYFVRCVFSKSEMITFYSFALSVDMSLQLCHTSIMSWASFAIFSQACNFFELLSTRGFAINMC